MGFQASIMASGNLSWLNFLTIILALPLIDGRWLAGMLHVRTPPLVEPGNIHKGLLLGLAVLVICLSIQPVINMLSPRQAMNASFNPFHLVGTYGAFGSVTKQRFEVIIEGTRSSTITPSAQWVEYEFKGKPGNLQRMPPQVAPYHLRLDWLMWFAGFSPWEQNPWFLHLMQKLLEGDGPTLGLMGRNPFPDGPPHYVRAELYEYKFTTPAERKATGKWWDRTPAGEYFPAVSLDDPGFRRLLRDQGWL
jgi:hypothetical protein